MFKHARVAIEAHVVLEVPDICVVGAVFPVGLGVDEVAHPDGPLGSLDDGLADRFRLIEPTGRPTQANGP